MLRPRCRALPLVAACLLGCGDPVRDAIIAELGPEDPAVRPGPLHRPNQPCLACHDHVGGEHPILSVAGTVYRERGMLEPLGGADVIITDSGGRTHRVRSNCAGNFYVEENRFVPRYPFWITVEMGALSIDMESPVFREGSCAACHADPASPRSAGAVYLTDDPNKARMVALTRCSGNER